MIFFRCHFPDFSASSALLAKRAPVKKFFTLALCLACMRTGGITGSEALVRWNHPTRGLLPPGSFIPLFERNGFVTSIDFFVFEQACRDLRSWKLRNLPLHTVSCNFSRLHFDHPHFTDRLADIANHYGVAHHLLEVEITESAIMPCRSAQQIHHNAPARGSATAHARGATGKKCFRFGRLIPYIFILDNWLPVFLQAIWLLATACHHRF